MPRILVVGGSIAATTAAVALRREGWTGELIMLSEEHHPPYSRVPLSKGVLARTATTESTALPSLPADVEVRLGHQAVALDLRDNAVQLADSTTLGFDGLVIATGARARRLAAPGQLGELVVRTLEDAHALASRVGTAKSAIVVGGGFLGMEVASGLVEHGLHVTVVDCEPPLERLLGPWLANLVTESARLRTVNFVLAPGAVSLLGNPVRGVSTGAVELCADLVVSAVGDIANIEWLTGSGLLSPEGLVVDEYCRVTPSIVAAGDVTLQRDNGGTLRRNPHWTSAVGQATSAARALLHADATPHVVDHYFWTEQFGLDLKIAGRLPATGHPVLVDGDAAEHRMLLRWHDETGQVTTAVSVNYRMPIVKLKAMLRAVAPTG